MGVRGSILSAARPPEALPSEDQEQAWLVAWFRRQYPFLRIFAVPNGGHRHKATAAMLKATGATAGVPDLLIPASRKGWHGLFIEMKRTKGGTISPEQKDWLAHLNEQGYRAEVCKGFEAAKAVIKDYFA